MIENVQRLMSERGDMIELYKHFQTFQTTFSTESTPASSYYNLGQNVIHKRLHFSKMETISNSLQTVNIKDTGFEHLSLLFMTTNSRFLYFLDLAPSFELIII